MTKLLDTVNAKLDAWQSLLHYPGLPFTGWRWARHYVEDWIANRGIELRPWKLGHYYTRGGEIRTPHDFAKRPDADVALSLAHECMHDVLEDRVGWARHGALYVFSTAHRCASEVLCDQQLAILHASVRVSSFAELGRIIEHRADGLAGCKYALVGITDRGLHQLLLDRMHAAWLDQRRRLRL